MTPKRTPFKVAYDSELLDTIKGIAKRESRTVSAQIQLMLRKQVEAEADAQK